MVIDIVIEKKIINNYYNNLEYWDASPLHQVWRSIASNCTGNGGKWARKYTEQLALWGKTQWW